MRRLNLPAIEGSPTNYYAMGMRDRDRQIAKALREWASGQVFPGLLLAFAREIDPDTAQIIADAADEAASGPDTKGE